MAICFHEESDAVLSDVDADDAVPILVVTKPNSDISVDRFRQVLEELNCEKAARIEAESSKSELLISFNRLKLLAHDAMKNRDQFSRQRNEISFERDEALRSNDKLSCALTESVNAKNEVIRQRDEFSKKLDQALKAKDSYKSEMETAAHMLVKGIEKISRKVSRFRDFSAGDFPRSEKYTGILAVAYDVIKRTNDIVEELLTHGNDERRQIDQRNYEIAIEVSQLESTISGLRQEISNKTLTVQILEKSVSEKDDKISDLETKILEKEDSAKNEVAKLKQLMGECDIKLRQFELKMNMQRPLLVDQRSYVKKLHNEIYNVIKLIDASKVDEFKLPELSESSSMPRENDIQEGNLDDCLAEMELTYELCKQVAAKSRDLVDERSCILKSLNKTASELVVMKERVRSLLRNVMSISTAVQSSKMHELLEIADFGVCNRIADRKVSMSDSDEDEIFALAGAIESIRQQVEAQAMKLVHTIHLKEELEEKERVANENVEGLMIDIASAEEEITRWKIAAQREAAAGKAVEQEFMAQLSVVGEELNGAKRTAIELEEKFKYKEEIAEAAMSARDAAEKSLKLADLRTTRLREKVEELASQLEELDKEGNSRAHQKTRRYVCWPWQWNGLTRVGLDHSKTPHEGSREMELSKPLL